ncbi:hypothetical protein VTN02DRAFT_6775 [Thermoascus thermophilus]
MDDIETWVVKEPYLVLNSPLLEGPFYNADRDELRFVDIYAEKVFVLNMSKGPETLREFSTKDNTIGVTADIEGSDDLIYAGAKHGFATLNRKTGELSYFRKLFNEETAHKIEHRMRANDGAVDCRGRIFQGFMFDDRLSDPTEDGVLLRLDPDGSLHRVVENVITPNGLGWNRDNTVMFWAESRSGNVYAFDYDANTGNIRNQRVFFHLDGANNVNVPDGLVVDEEDNIWLAVWGGCAVLRISPDGKVTGKIELPTRFVTCPVFVGTELFITTAMEVEPDKYPESASYAGNIYRVDVGVKGLPRYKVPMPA